MILPNWRQWIPLTLTFGNLAAGFAVIWVALTQQEKFWDESAELFTLLGLIMLAGCICDFLDGFTARKWKTTSSLGLELDSLADLISFGVAPIVIFYLALFDERPSVFSFAACLWYLLAGAFRLARFNNAAHEDEAPRSFFDGLPITGASLLWVSFLLFLGQEHGSSLLAYHETGLRRATILLFALLGVLMVSHLPYRSLKTPIQNKRAAQRNALLVLLLSLIAGRLFGHEIVPIGIVLAYVFGTPLIATWKKIYKPKLRI